MNGTQTTPLTCGTKDNTQTANGNQVNTQAVGTQYKTRNRHGTLVKARVVLHRLTITCTGDIKTQHMG